jgi:hypothetical protein
MNEDYFKQQAERVRAIADKADPFTKRRLLDLADAYDVRLGKPSRAVRELKSTAVPTTRPGALPPDDVVKPS